MLHRAAVRGHQVQKTPDEAQVPFCLSVLQAAISACMVPRVLDYSNKQSLLCLPCGRS